MAKDEAKVRVSLDTRQAKSELRDLAKAGVVASKRVGRGLRSTVSRGLGAVGLGGGIGIGLAAVRRSTSSGFADVIGESLGAWGAQLSRFFLGDLPSKAAAAKSAREETIQTFGTIAGHTGKIPAGAKGFFDQIRALRFDQEEGRRLFEEDKSGQFHGPKLEKVIDRIMAGLSTLLSGAVTELALRLINFKSSSK